MQLAETRAFNAGPRTGKKTQITAVMTFDHIPLPKMITMSRQMATIGVLLRRMA